MASGYILGLRVGSSPALLCTTSHKENNVVGGKGGGGENVILEIGIAGLWASIAIWYNGVPLWGIHHDSQNDWNPLADESS